MTKPRALTEPRAVTELGVTGRPGRPSEPGHGAADYSALIRPHQVHGSLYTSPAIFAEELAKIWYRPGSSLVTRAKSPSPTTTCARSWAARTSS